MDVDAIGKGLAQLRDVGDMGQHPAASIWLYSAEISTLPGAAMKAVRIRRPSPGADRDVSADWAQREDSRPVVVAASA